MRKVTLVTALVASLLPAGSASAAIVIDYGGDVEYDHVSAGTSTLSLLGRAISDDPLIGLGNTLDLDAVFLGAEERDVLESGELVTKAVGRFGTTGGRDWTIRADSDAEELLFGSVLNLEFTGTKGATGEPFVPFPGAPFTIDPPIARISADLLIEGGALGAALAPEGLLLSTVFDVSCEGIDPCGFAGAWGVDVFGGDFSGVPVFGSLESELEDSAVPEAGTWLLAGAGLIGLIGVRRRVAAQ